MSRDPSATMTKFLNCLDLIKEDENLFLGHSPDFGWRRIFGGQLIAQSLAAASRTVKADRAVHSLHSYFLRPGDPDIPLYYRVHCIRDGASFSMRSVEALQSNQVIFTMQVSFHRSEAGFDHQAIMPDVPSPEELDIENVFNAKDATTEPLKLYMNKERPFQFVPVSMERYLNAGYLEPEQSVWLRLIKPLDDGVDAYLHPVILSYLSDMLLVDTALFPHGVNIFDQSVQGASLDHAIWFHRLFLFDDWVLYHMDSPSSAGSRGMARGSLFKRDGTLVASVAQEGLIRKRANARKIAK